jgi:LuxR family maltose regulon positive regulatory protein
MHRHRLRVFATIFRTTAYQMAGNLETGLARYRGEIDEHMSLMGDYRAIYLVNLCNIFWIGADLKSMQQTAVRSLEVVRARQLHEATAASLYFVGVASYHQNNLQDAEEKLTLLVEDFYFINLTRTTHASIALSLVYIARGDFNRVSKLCQKAMTRVVIDNNQAGIDLLRAFEAEIALYQGRLMESVEWAAAQDKVQPFLLPFLFYSPKLTLIKILFSQNTTESWAQGVDLLNRYDDYLQSVNNQRFRIDTLAFKAIVHKERGNIGAARQALNEALTIAKKGEFLRIFTNTGTHLVDLLKQQLIQDDSKMSYINQILAVLAEDEANKKKCRADYNPTYYQSLPCSLTNRELDMLHMLADRLRNKEIAATLNISTETVKSHLKALFKKLGVNNRRDAVYKAVALGFMSVQ